MQQQHDKMKRKLVFRTHKDFFLSSSVSASVWLLLLITKCQANIVTRCYYNAREIIKLKCKTVQHTEATVCSPRGMSSDRNATRCATKMGSDSSMMLQTQTFIKKLCKVVHCGMIIRGGMMGCSSPLRQARHFFRPSLHFSGSSQQLKIEKNNNNFVIFIKWKDAIRSIHEMKCQKSGLFTNYCMGWVGQSNFEWNTIHYLQCKQFQFVDSLLFGQVRHVSIILVTVEILFRQSSTPPKKKCLHGHDICGGAFKIANTAVNIAF